MEKKNVILNLKPSTEQFVFFVRTSLAITDKIIEKSLLYVQH